MTTSSRTSFPISSRHPADDADHQWTQPERRGGGLETERGLVEQRDDVGQAVHRGEER